MLSKTVKHEERKYRFIDKNGQGGFLSPISIGHEQDNHRRKETGVVPIGLQGNMSLVCTAPLQAHSQVHCGGLAMFQLLNVQPWLQRNPASP